MIESGLPESPTTKATMGNEEDANYRFPLNVPYKYLSKPVTTIDMDDPIGAVLTTPPQRQSTYSDMLGSYDILLESSCSYSSWAETSNTNNSCIYDDRQQQILSTRDGELTISIEAPCDRQEYFLQYEVNMHDNIDRLYMKRSFRTSIVPRRTLRIRNVDNVVGNVQDTEHCWNRRQGSSMSEMTAVEETTRHQRDHITTAADAPMPSLLPVENDSDTNTTNNSNSSMNNSTTNSSNDRKEQLFQFCGKIPYWRSSTYFGVTVANVTKPMILPLHSGIGFRNNSNIVVNQHCATPFSASLSSGKNKSNSRQQHLHWLSSHTILPHDIVNLIRQYYHPPPFFHIKANDLWIEFQDLDKTIYLARPR